MVSSNTQWNDDETPMPSGELHRDPSRWFAPLPLQSDFVWPMNSRLATPVKLDNPCEFVYVVDKALCFL